MSIQSDAVSLLETALSTLEQTKSKTNVTSAVQQIRRAATMVNDTEIAVWCAIQLGEDPYVSHCRAIIDAAKKKNKARGKEKERAQSVFVQAWKAAKKDGVANTHVSNAELRFKTDPCGGGYSSIAFIEEQHAQLVRLKRGNNGQHYVSNLLTHLSYIRTEAHKRASRLLLALKYADTARTSFDILKEAVDDKLLDFAPEIAEQLMLAFQAVSSAKPESWSQALTTCRRLLEAFADKVFPPQDSPIEGRKVGKAQYINRLWAFMDNSIKSGVNEAMAKAHVDYLGAWLERTYKVTHKGVHANLHREEAVKAVFHLYLVIADLLHCLPPTSQPIQRRKSIQDATLDELEAVLGINRTQAKRIVKLRVEKGELTPSLLGSIRGIGSKTVARAKEGFEFNEE